MSVPVKVVDSHARMSVSSIVYVVPDGYDVALQTNGVGGTTDGKLDGTIEVVGPSDLLGAADGMVDGPSDLLGAADGMVDGPSDLLGAADGVVDVMTTSMLGAEEGSSDILPFPFPFFPFPFFPLPSFCVGHFGSFLVSVEAMDEKSWSILRSMLSNALSKRDDKSSILSSRPDSWSPIVDINLSRL